MHWFKLIIIRVSALPCIWRFKTQQIITFGALRRLAAPVLGAEISGAAFFCTRLMVFQQKGTPGWATNHQHLHFSQLFKAFSNVRKIIVLASFESVQKRKNRGWLFCRTSPAKRTISSFWGPFLGASNPFGSLYVTFRRHPTICIWGHHWVGSKGSISWWLILA